MKATTNNKDNKYCKVLIMVQRAKQLHNGAPPRIQMPGSRDTRIAIEEVERKLIGYEHGVVPSR